MKRAIETLQNNLPYFWNDFNKVQEKSGTKWKNNYMTCFQAFLVGHFIKHKSSYSSRVNPYTSRKDLEVWATYLEKS